MVNCIKKILVLVFLFLLLTTNVLPQKLSFNIRFVDNTFDVLKFKDVQLYIPEWSHYRAKVLLNKYASPLSWPTIQLVYTPKYNWFDINLYFNRFKNTFDITYYFSEKEAIDNIYKFKYPYLGDFFDYKSKNLNLYANIYGFKNKLLKPFVSFGITYLNYTILRAFNDETAIEKSDITYSIISNSVPKNLYGLFYGFGIRYRNLFFYASASDALFFNRSQYPDFKSSQQYKISMGFPIKTITQLKKNNHFIAKNRTILKDNSWIDFKFNFKQSIYNSTNLVNNRYFGINEYSSNEYQVFSYSLFNRGNNTRFSTDGYTIVSISKAPKVAGTPYFGFTTSIKPLKNVFMDLRFGMDFFVFSFEDAYFTENVSGDYLKYNTYTNNIYSYYDLFDLAVLLGYNKPLKKDLSLNFKVGIANYFLKSSMNAYLTSEIKDKFSNIEMAIGLKKNRWEFGLFSLFSTSAISKYDDGVYGKNFRSGITIDYRLFKFNKR